MSKIARDRALVFEPRLTLHARGHLLFNRLLERLVVNAVVAPLRHARLDRLTVDLAKLHCGWLSRRCSRRGRLAARPAGSRNEVPSETTDAL